MNIITVKKLSNKIASFQQTLISLGSITNTHLIQYLLSHRKNRFKNPSGQTLVISISGQPFAFLANAPRNARRALLSAADASGLAYHVEKDGASIKERREETRRARWTARNASWVRERDEAYIYTQVREDVAARKESGYFFAEGATGGGGGRGNNRHVNA